MKEKTIATGIRYKASDVDIIKKREQLHSIQEVFYFLVAEYLKLYKVEKKSIFATQELPKDYIAAPSIKFEKPVYEGSKDSIVKIDEVGMFSDPAGQYEVFKKDIYECRTVQEIEGVMKMVKGALMFLKEKQTLESIAKEHSKDFYTD